MFFLFVLASAAKPARLLLFILLLAGGQSHAQTNVYHPFPDSAVWRVDYYYDEPFQMDWCFVNYYFQYYTSGDTVINSFIHKKIYRSFELVNIQTCSSYSIYPSGQPAGYAGALRDDSLANKTFFVFPNKNNDSLLYDYNLNVGDTMKGFISQYPYGYNMVVLSVDSILVNGNYRKRWNFSQNYNNDYPYIIEGIGTSFGLIEWVRTYNIDFTYRYLVCVKDSTSTLFVSGYNSAKGCVLIVDGTDEINIEDSFQIFPNPSSGIFTLSSSEKISSVEILNVLGKQIYKKQVKNQKGEIDLSSHPQGIYFVKAMDEKGNFGVRKIILQ